jgi:aspartate carbamoyltransferase catalytic subunit
MRHLLSTNQLDGPQAIALLDKAAEMSKLNSESSRKFPTLQGKTVVTLFFENSTRTRISFELAAKRLSADVINFSAETSAVSKGENLKDTAQTLEALGADALIMRHPSSGAAYSLANSDWTTAKIINAGDGTNQHPTQALLDALTMREGFEIGSGQGLKGKKVLIVGDIVHSRVARSNLDLLPKLGAEVEFAGPGSFAPGSKYSDLDEALEAAPDAIMMLRVQKERMNQPLIPSDKEYAKLWGLTEPRVKRIPNSLILHPGPMNRGLEISSYAAESEKSLVLQQVKNGLAVRMAVLANIFGGDDAAI